MQLYGGEGGGPRFRDRPRLDPLVYVAPSGEKIGQLPGVQASRTRIEVQVSASFAELMRAGSLRSNNHHLPELEGPRGPLPGPLPARTPRNWAADLAKRGIPAGVARLGSIERASPRGGPPTVANDTSWLTSAPGTAMQGPQESRYVTVAQGGAIDAHSPGGRGFVTQDGKLHREPTLGVLQRIQGRAEQVARTQQERQQALELRMQGTIARKREQRERYF